MEWPSTGAGLGPSLVEAGLESGKMGNELVLGFTGMGPVQGKVDCSLHSPFSMWRGSFPGLHSVSFGEG